jgi:hypothetical protein
VTSRNVRHAENAAGDGSSSEKDCICPGWFSVDDLAHADLKALLAHTGLSLGAPHAKEL